MEDIKAHESPISRYVDTKAWILSVTELGGAATDVNVHAPRELPRAAIRADLPSRGQVADNCNLPAPSRAGADSSHGVL